MKIYKEVVIPEKIEQREYKRICDLCGLEAKYFNWNADVYRVNETEIAITIKQKDGTAYPEGGNGGDKYEIDLCPNCFKERLVPWLISQGANIKPIEWEW